MAKLPYLPLYTGDWVKDPALTLCTPATRGIWIDLLCAMHERGRCGELLGTVDQLSRFARCTAAELALALDDLHTTGAAVVQKRDTSIFVRNRRMYEESQKRKSNAERQKRHREVCRNAESNGDVALDIECDIDASFELFWSLFPKGRKKSKGKAREAFGKAICKVNDLVIIEAAKKYAASDEGQGPYVKMPSTWLNQECWDDDPNAWRSKDAKPRVTEGQRFREQ